MEIENKNNNNENPNDTKKDETKMNIIKEEDIGKEKTINYGDLVIIYENGDSVKYFTLEKGKKYKINMELFPMMIYMEKILAAKYIIKITLNLFQYYLLYQIYGNVV